MPLDRLRRRTRRTPSTRGQALVEFALVANLLIVLLFAITQLGLVLWTYLNMTQAARDGARAAAVQRESGVASMATAAERAVISSAGDDPAGTRQTTANWVIRETPPASGGTTVLPAGTPYTVTVDYDYTVNLIILPSLTLSLRAKSVMRAE